MIELLGLTLIPAAILVVLHYLDNVQDIERKEMQKLVSEIAN